LPPGTIKDKLNTGFQKTNYKNKLLKLFFEQKEQTTLQQLKSMVLVQK
jgi:hypothetical protein